MTADARLEGAVPSSLDRRQLYIGGEWQDSEDGRPAEVVNPADGSVVAEVQLAGVRDADRAVSAAHRSFSSGEWSATPPSERAAVLRRAADHLADIADRAADTTTAEMGALQRYTRGVALPNALRHLRLHADLIEAQGTDVRTDELGTSVVHRRPVGVVAAITPWNGPVGSAIMKVAPAIAAGCSIVLKPPPESPLSPYAIADAFHEAGLPPGVLSVIPGGREVGAALAEDARVDKVAFTGSTVAGRAIMAACATRIARVTLELGGKSVALMLDDADVPACVRVWTPSMTFNTGQACYLQSRLLVPRHRHDEVVDQLADAFAQVRIGDPFDPDVQMGPLANQGQRERVEGYLDLARSDGLTVIGGQRPAGMDRGSFLAPALIVGADNTHRVAQEEIFGPVVTVIGYDTVDEAVAIANDSIYGLGGSVWSSDPSHATAVAQRIRTGQVSVNGAPHAFTAPFGGFKQSGLGREMGPEALANYQELQAVAVEEVG